MNYIIKKYQYVKSTNELARKYKLKSSSDKIVLVSEYQTAGTGRNTHSWESPKGGLWLTIVVSSNKKERLVSQITLVAGVAVVEVLANVFKIKNAYIKWPNDILVNGKKICGILCELVLSCEDDLQKLIIGIGLNVNISPTQFSSSISTVATSMLMEIGKVLDLDKVLDELLRSFESYYNQWEKNGFDAIKDKWIFYDGTIGNQVLIKDNDKLLCVGKAVGINDNGALIIENKEGIHFFDIGEVSLR